MAASRSRAEIALALFCAATVVFLAFRDLGIPAVGDVEVWGGFELHGRAARLTAPVHWALFAFGAWAFWRAKPWAFAAAAGYVFYVAASHLLWNVLSPDGDGWIPGLLEAGGFALVGIGLLRLRRRTPHSIPRA